MTRERQDAAAGRVCLVTGANRGIGKATALALARMGATVAIASRDPSQGERAAAEIRSTAGGPVHVFQVDYCDPDSVTAFARRVVRELGSLHVLVNNHGTAMRERAEGPYGVERTLAVNHLGYFTTTLLLLELLKRSAPSRIVNVASDAHYRSRLDLSDLAARDGFHPRRAYADSKLANVLFTYELARRLEGTGVTANCLHPGVIRTKLLRTIAVTYAPWAKPVIPIAQVVFGSPARGARTSIHLASSPEVEGVSGKYFRRCRAVRSSERSYDPGLQRALWEASARLTGVGG